MSFDTFSDIPGRTSIVKVDIVLEKDRVVNVKPFPMPLSLRCKLDMQIDSMKCGTPRMSIVANTGSPIVPLVSKVFAARTDWS